MAPSLVKSSGHQELPTISGGNSPTNKSASQANRILDEVVNSPSRRRLKHVTAYDSAAGWGGVETPPPGPVAVPAGSGEGAGGEWAGSVFGVVTGTAVLGGLYGAVKSGGNVELYRVPWSNNLVTQEEIDLYNAQIDQVANQEELAWEARNAELDDIGTDIAGADIVDAEGFEFVPLLEEAGAELLEVVEVAAELAAFL